ncbi:hypothetical protein [Natrarchaeobius oligotrophus]|uniref:hypothetical protein n=1 Tax=Natrarchaeobius oligotrophus TaxID=3455743 RepID=UPI001FB52E30|nr:hypothetical protein [Natrarchaeobius chitinivorans]
MSPDSSNASERSAGGEQSAGSDRVERSSAERVVVSSPADLSRWGRFQVEKPSFRAFLRKIRRTAREGDQWNEFVGVGCCGDTLDVPLRVERIDGGSRLSAGTEIEYEERDACGLDGSWRVQSAGGPRRA